MPSPLEGITAALLAGPAAAVGVFPVMAIYIAIYRVRIFEGGLRASDYHGRSHSILWQEMRTPESARSFGLSFIRVPSTDPRRELWIPRFLCDFQGFGDQIVRHAGPLHPLSEAVKAAA